MTGHNVRLLHFLENISASGPVYIIKNINITVKMDVGADLDSKSDSQEAARALIQV